MKKPPAPTVGAVYEDRDLRRSRRVKVQKRHPRDRMATCANMKTGKVTKISYATLASRFDHVVG